MEVSFLVWKLPAFTVSMGKRLAKSPRLLWVDSGLAAHLAECREKSELTDGRLWGAWLEALGRAPVEGVGRGKGSTPGVEHVARWLHHAGWFVR
jgi:hypothetical protein